MSERRDAFDHTNIPTHMKKIILTATFAATALFASPTVSAAQAVDPYPASDPGVCLLTPSVFVGVSPTKCYGFFDGNSAVAGFSTGQSVSSSSNTTAWNALMSFGFSSSGTYSVLEKRDWNGTTNFTTAMSGWTVIGLHWGNYPNALDNGTDFGNVSAFYLFDAGSTPTTDLNLVDTQGISNANIIYTNGACTDRGCGPFITSVPEPSTYALMASGLLGIFGFARRRRNNA